MIDNFAGEYDFLSNFYNVAFQFDGSTFHNSEAAFQAAKTFDGSARKLMTKMNPSEAKKLGRNVTLRKDWEEIKDRVMFNVCFAKFSQNPDLKRRLLATGTEELIEGNRWHDNYWGDCKCPKCADIEGRNQLGKTLMQLRDYFNMKSEFDSRELFQWAVSTTTHWINDYQSLVHRKG